MPSITASPELSIVMPCLNEAETLGACIRKAQTYLATSHVDGEIVVADNGSTDGSQQIALNMGARVVNVTAPGYGSALLGGINAARGTYVIMGDADDSYDFQHLDPFLSELRRGTSLVMGNRFSGGIEAGAMPPLHQYLGNPVLSAIGRIFFGIKVRDFHCGLRGFHRETVVALGLVSSGMEFASELVVRMSLAGKSMSEVPTRLARDGRSRPPHLRSWRDGWRHLRFLLLYSPNWLFLLPGAITFAIGVIGVLLLSIGPVHFGRVTLDVSSLVYLSGLAIVGYQALIFGALIKSFARREGFLPAARRSVGWVSRFTIERGLLIGVALSLAGVASAIVQISLWGRDGFGELNSGMALRVAVPSALALSLGIQTTMSSMFAGIFSIARQ